MEKINSFFEDVRNITDEFKGLPTEEIKSKLVERSLPFAVAMLHLDSDFNIGTVLRCANAFGAREMYYVGGKKHYDKRAACGVYNYTNFKHFKTVEEFFELKNQYCFVGLENNTESIPMESFNWRIGEPDFRMPLIILGEENSGIPKEILSECDFVVTITQRGSVRSLNAGVAAGISIHDFCTKYTGHLCMI